MDEFHSCRTFLMLDQALLIYLAELWAYYADILPSEHLQMLAVAVVSHRNCILNLPTTEIIN